MPTPDASAFTRQQKYNAVGERGTTSNNGTKPVTHLTSYVPKVTGLSNFLPSFSNKVVSPLKVSFINTTQKPKKFQDIVPVSSSVFIVIGGAGTNTLLYSTDGNTFTGLGNTSFSSNVLAIVYSSTLKVWLAGGSGTNTLAYSPDGKTWTGLGKTIISSSVYTFAYSPTLNRWVAGGTGTNTLAYATDPTTVGGANGWTASSSGTSVFTNCLSIVWSPTFKGGAFIAGGTGTNTLAYSTNGTTWIPISISGITQVRAIGTTS